MAIMATGHSMCSSLSINDFKKCCIVVDTVRLLNKENFVNSKLIYVALGAWLIRHNDKGIYDENDYKPDS